MNRTGESESSLFPYEGYVSHTERCRLMKNDPLTLWLTGLSASGKSTIAYSLERRLTDDKIPCYVLDGDNIRRGLNRDLGFSPDERHENLRRVAETARLFNDAGLTVICAFISPFEADRKIAREIIGKERFREIFINTDLGLCRERDPKGLYKRALSGEIPDFTGISSPYEIPLNPDCEISTDNCTVSESVDKILKTLFSK